MGNNIITNIIAYFVFTISCKIVHTVHYCSYNVWNTSLGVMGAMVYYLSLVNLMKIRRKILVTSKTH